MIYIIKYFDCFAGIGGFRSGLERAGGFECVGFCEIDKFAASAYRAIFDTKGEQYFEDIRAVDADKIAEFDLFVGGFPCQPFSLSGGRRSFNDPRGTLIYQVARILEAKRPRAFLLENVAGLLQIDLHRSFAEILRLLSELGYCVEWQCPRENLRFSLKQRLLRSTAAAIINRLHLSGEQNRIDATASDYCDYGKRLLAKMLPPEFNKALLNHLDSYSFARHLAAANNVDNTDYGMISAEGQRLYAMPEAAQEQEETENFDLKM